MKKHLPTIVAILFGVVAVVFFMKSCAGDARLQKAKLDYNLYKRVVEANNEIQQANILKAEKTIATQNEKIIATVEQSKADRGKIASLSAQLISAQNQEPSYPDMETHPLVINLRYQIAKLTDMFNLSEQDNRKKDEIIAGLGVPRLVRVENGVRIYEYPVGSTTWALNEKALASERKYDNEHDLRMKCEGLVKQGEKRGVIIDIFGMHINLVRDVVVPGVTFTLGYFAGK